MTKKIPYCPYCGGRLTEDDEETPQVVQVGENRANKKEFLICSCFGCGREFAITEIEEESQIEQEKNAYTLCIGEYEFELVESVMTDIDPNYKRFVTPHTVYCQNIEQMLRISKELRAGETVYVATERWCREPGTNWMIVAIHKNNCTLYTEVFEEPSEEK